MEKKSKIKIEINKKEYKDLFQKVVWSGAIHGTSRKLEVDYIAKENICQVVEMKLFFLMMMKNYFMERSLGHQKEEKSK